jgi:hypothetical protein
LELLEWNAAGWNLMNEISIKDDENHRRGDDKRSIPNPNLPCTEPWHAHDA